MQGISVLGLVAERRPHPRTPALREVPLFQTVFLPRHNFFGRGLLLSAILHSLCIYGGPPLLDLLPESDAEALKRLVNTTSGPSYSTDGSVSESSCRSPSKLLI